MLLSHVFLDAASVPGRGRRYLSSSIKSNNSHKPHNGAYFAVEVSQKFSLTLSFQMTMVIYRNNTVLLDSSKE